MRMIVACTNASGEPDFHVCDVAASEAQIEDGEHYDLAKESAEKARYEGPMVAFERQEFVRALSYIKDELL